MKIVENTPGIQKKAELDINPAAYYQESLSRCEEFVRANPSILIHELPSWAKNRFQSRQVAQLAKSSTINAVIRQVSSAAWRIKANLSDSGYGVLQLISMIEAALPEGTLDPDLTEILKDAKESVVESAQLASTIERILEQTETLIK